MPLQGSSDQALHSLEEENKRLKRAVDELPILDNLARAIGASLNTQEIVQTIIRRSLRALNAEQGVISLVEEQSVQSMKTLVRTMVSSSEHEQFHLSQALLGWMHLNKKAIVINNQKTDHGRRQPHPVVRTAKGFDSEAGKPAEGSTGLPTRRDAP
jgi:GAF domain-containing protein